MSIYLAIITTICTFITAFGFIYGKSYLETTWQKIAETERARQLAYESEMGKIKANSESIEGLTRTVENIRREIELGKIKYTKLHEKRIAVIEDIYEMVIILNRDIQDYMAPFQASKSGKPEDFDKEHNEKRDIAIESFNRLHHFYQIKKLFFDGDVRQQADNLLSTVRSKFMDYTSLDRMKSYGLVGKDLNQEYQKRNEASDYVYEEVPKMLTALEKELQKTLGVGEQF
jgi:hypothetical protein